MCVRERTWVRACMWAVARTFERVALLIQHAKRMRHII